ncbi:MAG: hypothetical protein O7G29_03700 [Acidobacteria bacterium]|nr:hypothetical protein [Acidobacteriota bacterium]
MNTTTKVYLDTNVFDHILNKKGGITEKHVLRFQSALQTGQFLVPVSLLAVEETLLALESHPETAKKQLKLIQILSDDRFVLKPPGELLEGEIQAFGGSDDVSPFLGDDSIRNMLQNVVTDPPRPEELDEVISEVRLQKEQFREAMREAKKQVSKDLGNIQDEPPSFHDYFMKAAPFLAEEYALRAKTSERRQKIAVDKLLEIRSVRLSVGANLSLAYGQIVEGWSPNLGDGIDMRHVVPASACEYLISNDKRFRRIVERVPITDFRVFDFASFVEEYL